MYFYFVVLLRKQNIWKLLPALTVLPINININIGHENYTSAWLDREWEKERGGGLHKPQDLYFHSCHELCSPHSRTYTNTSDVGLKSCPQESSVMQCSALWVERSNGGLFTRVSGSLRRFRGDQRIDFSNQERKACVGGKWQSRFLGIRA